MAWVVPGVAAALSATWGLAGCKAAFLEQGSGLGSPGFDSCGSVPCRPAAAPSVSQSHHDPLDIPQGL